MAHLAGTELQLLEFALGEDVYCVAFDVVAEIVDTAEVTPVPNTSSHIEGIMDLRGRTTTIVDPKELLDLTVEGTAERDIVFDPDFLASGVTIEWLVDEAYRVVVVSEEAIDRSSVVDDDIVRGIVRRADSFAALVDPGQVPV